MIIAKEVMSDLIDRMEVGKNEYGVLLSTHNGRDALQDAYEEALDLACYLKQAMLERDDCTNNANSKLPSGGSQGISVPECNARQETTGSTDELSAGGVRVQYNKSGSDNPELAPRHSTRIRRSTRVSYVDAPSQEVQDEVRKTINFILEGS